MVHEDEGEGVRPMNNSDLKCNCTAQGFVYRGGCPVHDPSLRRNLKTFNLDDINESHREMFEERVVLARGFGDTPTEVQARQALKVLDQRRKEILPEGSYVRKFYDHLEELMSECQIEASWSQKMYLTGNILEFFSRGEKM